MDVVFFDGVCGLCNRFVDFLLRHDTKKKLKFSPLQGVFIQKSPAAFLASEETVVFLKGDQVFIKSKAAIECVASLGGFWVMVKVFLLVPRVIRDLMYDWIARHRYGWFGKVDACRILKVEETKYFLE